MEAEGSGQAGGLASAGHRGQPRVSGGGLDLRQLVTDQGRGLVGVGVQAHVGLALGRLAPVLGAGRVGLDHRATQPALQFRDGVTRRVGQHAGLDRAGRLFGQDRGGVGDGSGPVQVDAARHQRRAGIAQPPVEGDGQVSPRPGAAGRHGQRERDLA